MGKVSEKSTKSKAGIDLNYRDRGLRVAIMPSPNQSKLEIAMGSPQSQLSIGDRDGAKNTQG